MAYVNKTENIFNDTNLILGKTISLNSVAGSYFAWRAFNYESATVAQTCFIGNKYQEFCAATQVLCTLAVGGG